MQNAEILAPWTTVNQHSRMRQETRRQRKILAARMRPSPENAAHADDRLAVSAADRQAVRLACRAACVVRDAVRGAVRPGRNGVGAPPSRPERVRAELAVESARHPPPQALHGCLDEAVSQ